MPLTNRDASQITRTKQSKVLYGFKSNLGTNTIRQEQPSSMLNSVLLERQKGACPCNNDTNPTYPNNPVNNSSANNGGA